MADVKPHPVKRVQRFERLYKEARAAAEDAAGGPRAFRIIGSTFAQALVKAEALGIIYRQDESAWSTDFAYKFTDYVMSRLDEDLTEERI